MLTALITGTSRGIGAELCKQFMDHGWKVYALARRPHESQELQNLQKKYGDKLVMLTADVSSRSSLQAVAKALPADTKFDLLINNAGVMMPEEKNFEDIDADKVLETVNVNAVSSLRVVQAFLPFLQRSALPRIVNISSLMGSIADNAQGGAYGYRMSKAAVNMLTKNLACQFRNIISISIHPGWVKTAMGGTQAPLELPQSVSGIVKVIQDLRAVDNGAFLDHAGKKLPW